jgi:hypothetical protein
MRETDIVTVINIPGARRQAKKSAIAAMIREECDTTVIATLCNECGFDEAMLRSIMSEWRRDGAGEGTASDANASGRNQHSAPSTKTPDAVK